MIGGFNQLLESEPASRNRIDPGKKKMSDHANKSKSVFLAAMSHDLRTPMHRDPEQERTSLLSTQLNERQRRFTHNIEKAGRYWLLGIINDILEFAKIESGKLELLVSEFDLHVLVDDVKGLQEEIASGKPFTHQIDPAVPRRGHRRWAASDALTNLISNAIRYTDRGSVLVEVLSAGSHIVFSVTDTGIGIDPEKLPAMWSLVQVAAADGQRRSGYRTRAGDRQTTCRSHGGTVGVDTSLVTEPPSELTARLQQSGIRNWRRARLATRADLRLSSSPPRCAGKRQSPS